MSGNENTNGRLREAKKRSESTRNFAFELYDDSCVPNWKSELEKLHVKAVWIYHDKDVTVTGELKKPHHHVMIMWDGTMSIVTARNIAERFGAANNYIENIVSKRVYARYMCHLDQPDKYQYDISLMQSLGGVNVMKLIGETGKNKIEVVQDVLEFCRENQMWYYCDIIDYCFENNQIWANLLLDVRVGKLVQDYMHSLKLKYN